MRSIIKTGNTTISKWAGLLGIVLLVLVTNYTMQNKHRFHTLNAQLLKNPEFFGGLTHWSQRGGETALATGDVLSISTNSITNHSVFQKIPVTTPAFIRFSFLGNTDHLVPGTKRTAGASGVIIYRDKQGNQTGGRSIVILTGTIAEQKYSYLDFLNEKLGSIEIRFRIINARGIFEVRNPVVALLQERPLYTAAKACIVTLWLMLFITLVAVAMRRFNRLPITVTVVVSALVLAGTLSPATTMSAINDKLASILPGTMQSWIENTLTGVFGLNHLSGINAAISKTGHFLAFILLGIVASLFHRTLGLGFVAACVATFALLTESLQVLVHGRTPGFADFTLDITGGLIGIIIGYVSVQLINRYTNSPSIS